MEHTHKMSEVFITGFWLMVIFLIIGLISSIFNQLVGKLFITLGILIMVYVCIYETELFINKSGEQKEEN